MRVRTQRRQQPVRCRGCHQTQTRCQYLPRRSALERLDVVLEVNGESIVGDRLLSRVPMFGDMELTVLRLKEGVSQHQLDRAVRDARRGRLLARSKLRSDSPGCSESSDGEAV